MVLEALKSSTSVEACLRLPKPKELSSEADVSSSTSAGSFEPGDSVAVRLIPRERQLTRLLEYWFSDKNLGRDRLPSATDRGVSDVPCTNQRLAIVQSPFGNEGHPG